jgi:hypothetical protein
MRSGTIAIPASANALAHSHAGLYDWAVHHRLSGWQAKSWPAEIDVFLAVGELALYVAYLDGWPARLRIWPWTTALIGLVVSIAGNIGHIQAEPGQPVILADRLTAATSPLAHFAPALGWEIVSAAEYERKSELDGLIGNVPRTQRSVRPECRQATRTGAQIERGCAWRGWAAAHMRCSRCYPRGGG